MNAFEGIVAAMADALSRAPAIADGNIQRGTGRPVPEGVDQQVSLRLAGSNPSRGQIRGAPIDWTTTVMFESAARGSITYPSGSVTGDQAALALFQTAWERLFSDPTLGGLALDMIPAPFEIDEDELDNPVGCVRSAVQVLHRTAANTLEV